MTDGSGRFSRRTLLYVAGTAVAAGIAGPAPYAAGATARRLRPVSMAMHIHGPFSEGIGSFAAQLDQAERTGVDVIWWTDHDFRVAAHDHRQAVHFDGPSEPEETIKWDWTQSTEGTLASSSVEFVGEHSPDDPSNGLRLTATGGEAAGGTLWYAGTAWNFTYSTCIADTTLELDVRPEQVGPDAAFLLQMELSHHPAQGARPAGIYVLRYRFGGVTQRRHTADGLLGTVDVPATVDEWQRFTLPLVDDVRALWPDLVAEDNSLRKLQVGVTAGTGAPVSAVVDRLLFHRARREGQQGEDLRQEVLAAYRDSYADVTHHRAYEISLVRHLNWYGGDQTLPAFPSPPIRNNDPDLAESMVDFLHDRGGVVCWNHPMDVETRESLATLMIERNNLGADLVEIGRDPLGDLLWVFDVAARNAVFFTAVGTSDDHAGTDWLAPGERWFTGTWAHSTAQTHLVDALRRGRAWFADLALYRGALDIGVARYPAMGAVLITRSPHVTVDLTATQLSAQTSLEVVTGVVDLAGTADLQPATSTQSVHPDDLSDGQYRLRVPVGSGAYVRTQVRTADGAVIAVSNPLWLLRPESRRRIPAYRRLT